MPRCPQYGAGESQFSMVSHIMLPWRKEEPTTVPGTPVYHFLQGSLDGGFLLSARAFTHGTGQNRKLIVHVGLWNQQEKPVTVEQERSVRGKWSEEDLLYLASRMTFDIFVEEYGRLYEYYFATAE